MKYLKDYYVPVVVKNRDYLIGFLDASYAVSPLVEIEYSVLDSMRFNDLLPNGSRRRFLTDEQIIDILNAHDSKSNLVEFSPTNERLIPEEDTYLEITCTCGNYRRFKDSVEIPSSPIKCELCDKVMLDYTHSDDALIEYDGPKEKMMIGTEIEFVDEDDFEFDREDQDSDTDIFGDDDNSDFNKWLD